MTRRLLALFALAFAATPSPAADPPAFGKATQIEIKDRRAGWTEYEYNLNIPVEQGDMFRFEVSPVGQVDMTMYIEVWNAAHTQIIDSCRHGKKLDWTMTRGAVGKSITVHIRSDTAAKVNLRVTKLGDPVVTNDSGDDVKKLRTEVGELRKQLEAQAKDLAEIKQLLRDLKKP